MEFDAGPLYVDVIADTTGFGRDLQAKINAETARVKADITARIDAKKAEAELNRITAKERVVQVRAEVADARARAQLDAIASRKRVVTIRADADTAAAEAKLVKAAAKKRVAEVRAEADTAVAEARLQRLTRNRHIVLNVDTRQLGKAAGQLTSAGSAGLSLLKIPAAAAGIGTVAGALAQVTAGLFSIVSAAGPALNVLAAIPAVAGGIVQVAGAILTGFSGIGDAMKATEAAEKSAATTSSTAAASRVAAAERVRAAQDRVKQAAKDVANTEANAAQQISNAQDNVADAYRRTTRAVADAERDYARAQQDAIGVTRDLTRARQEAGRALQDLNAQLNGGRLSVEQGQIDVERAGLVRDQTNASSTSTSLEKRQADLNYREAVQRLEDLQRQQKRLEEEAAKANKAGVEGSDIVTEAKKRIQDANDRLVEQERKLREEREDGARAIAEAEEALAQARRSAAFQVQSARHQALLAQRDLAEAQRNSTVTAEKETAAQTAQAAAMAKLSPAGRQFVGFLRNTWIPAWAQVKKATQDALLPPVQQGMTAMLPLLGVVKDGLVDTATTVGGAFRDLATDVLANPLFQRDLSTIMDSNNRVLGSIGAALQPLTLIFTDLMLAAGPLVERFARFIDEGLRGIAVFVRTKRETGELAAFFERAGNTAAQLGRILGNVVRAVFNMGKAAGPAGRSLLGSFEEAVDKFEQWTGSMEGQNTLKDYFDDAAGTVRTVSRMIAGITRAFFRLGQNKGLTDILAKLETGFGPAFERALSSLTTALGPALIDSLTAIAELIAALAENGGGGLETFLQVITAVANGLTTLVNTPGVGEFITTMLKIAGAAAALAGIAGIVLRLTQALLIGGAMLQAFGGIALKVVMFVGRLFLASGPWGWIILAIGALVAGLIYAYKNFEWFRNAVDTIWALLKAAAIAVFNYLKIYFSGWLTAVKTIISGGLKLVKGVWDLQWGLIKTAVVTIFNGLKLWFDLWWTALRGVFDAAVKLLKGDWRGAWDSIRKTAVDVFTKAKDGIGTILGKIRDGFTTAVEAIGRIWDGLREVAKAPVKFLVDTIYNQGIRQLWNKVAGLVKLPELPALNIPGINAAEATKGVRRSSSGAGGRQSTPMARGGVLPGYAPGRDTIPVVASPGEGFLVPEAVQGLARMLGTTGGAAVNWLNSKFTSRVVGPSLDAHGHPSFAGGGVLEWVGNQLGRGRDALGRGTDFVATKLQDSAEGLVDLVAGALGPALATAARPIRELIDRVLPKQPPLVGLFGGTANALLDKVVGHLTNRDTALAPGISGPLPGGPTGGGGTGMGWQRMMQILRGAFPNLPLISGFRPGAITATGKASMHGKGRAVDIPPRMDVFEWIKQHFPNSFELIFTPAGGRQIYRGKEHVFQDPRTRSMHYDHVHWSYDDGGWLMPGQPGLNTSKTPEPVFSNPQWQTLKTVAANAMTGQTQGLAERDRTTPREATTKAPISMTINPPAGMQIHELARAVAVELEWSRR